LDVSKLPSGNYNLFVEVRDKENKVRARQQKFIQRSNPALATAKPAEAAAGEGAEKETLTFSLNIDTTRLNFYLLSHRPAASTEEVEFANTLVRKGTTAEKQRYLEHFWRKRDPLHAEAKWLDYKKRADYVDKTFRTKAFPGYETDRGRVYLQYGEPNLIHTERTDVNRSANQNSDVIPYQIWQYYHTETKNQNNVMFVFVQQNMASNSFKLTHSTARGEVNFPEWRSQIDEAT
jgi:GWxTD domain-containing protein